MNDSGATNTGSKRQPFTTADLRRFFHQPDVAAFWCQSPLPPTSKYSPPSPFTSRIRASNASLFPLHIAASSPLHHHGGLQLATMGFPNQSSHNDEKADPQLSGHVLIAIRNVLTKISKLKNTSSTTSGSSRTAMVGACNTDHAAANTSGCPASPRPAHASTFDGSGDDGANVDGSSHTTILPLPGTLQGTQGARGEGNQHPHPALIFGNHGPPPGLKGANGQPGLHAAARNQYFPKGQSVGTRGFRRLPPPPGFGPSFGNRQYPPGFRPPVMFEKCFSLASTRIVSLSEYSATLHIIMSLTSPQYDNTLYCDKCGGGSDLGWFYRCCHDTDARLFESIKDGHSVCMRFRDDCYVSRDKNKNAS